MDKTIKEIADSLGLPKNTVEHHFRQIRKEDPKFGSKSAETGGAWRLSQAEEERLKERIQGNSHARQEAPDKQSKSTSQAHEKYTTSTKEAPDKQDEDSDRNVDEKGEAHENRTTSTREADLYALLKDELAAKNEQLRVKDDQIRELNNRLADTTQALSNAQQLAQGAQALLAAEQQKLVERIDAEEAEIAEDPEPEPEKKKGFWSRIFRGN